MAMEHNNIFDKLQELRNAANAANALYAKNNNIKKNDSASTEVLLSGYSFPNPNQQLANQILNTNYKQVNYNPAPVPIATHYSPYTNRRSEKTIAQQTAEILRGKLNSMRLSEYEYKILNDFIWQNKPRTNISKRPERSESLFNLDFVCHHSKNCLIWNCKFDHPEGKRSQCSCLDSECKSLHRDQALCRDPNCNRNTCEMHHSYSLLMRKIYTPRAA